MKKILVIALALLACACAKKPAPEQLATAKETASIWQKMELASSEASTGPRRIQFSFRFGEEGDTRRVTGILWGNNNDQLRLDVMAGVGVTIARIMENDDYFLLYVPRENKAYVHQGAAKPMLNIGTPLPFNLPQLAAMLNGEYARVFGGEYATAELKAGGGAVFELDGGPYGLLELDAQGLPQKWTQKEGKWNLAVSYDGQPKPLPRSLRLNNANGKKAILLVKERERPGQDFSGEQMGLAVPDSVPLLPISRYRPS